MKDFIEVYENTLTKEVCDEIINYIDLALELMPEERKRGTIGAPQGDIYEPENKDSYDLMMKIDDDNEISRPIRNALLPKIDEYVQSNPQLVLLPPWKYRNSYNLQKYEPGMGFHLLHCENAGHIFQQSVDRLGAWMIYLNTITDGGSTYFDNYDRTVNAVQGRCVIWPAYWTHFHKGIVSKTETKYIATGWISFIDKA